MRTSEQARAEIIARMESATERIQNGANNKEQIIDQLYGFVMGVAYIHNDIEEDIGAMWGEWYRKNF